MNLFAEELRELIEKWRDFPGFALEEIIDALQAETDKLVEEVNGEE